MKTKFLGSTMLAILGWQTASAVEVAWFRLPGSARSITGSASGSLWITGTDEGTAEFVRIGSGYESEASVGYSIYNWDGTQFVKTLDVPSRKIAVDGSGQLYQVSDQNHLYGWVRHWTVIGGTFVPTGYRQALLSYNVRDVAIGGDNSVWIISTEERPGGYAVYRLAGVTNEWTNANIAAVDIAVDRVGNVWVVTDLGEIWRYDVASKKWDRIQASKARSIHAGAASGAVWMIGTTAMPGGYEVYQWDSSRRAWEQYGTSGAVDITEAAGVPWRLQSDGRLYRKIQPGTSPGPVPTQTYPPPTPQQQPPPKVTLNGRLLCSATGLNDCGDTQADYVGTECAT